MPPVTLTRGQFAQTKAGQKPGATYERYLSFVNNARKGSGTVVNSLAPSPAPDFNSLVGIASKALGPQLTDAQIAAKAQAAVAGQFAPISQSLTDLFGAQRATTSHAITGYTDSAASALGAIPKPDYGAAIKSRADAGAALGGFLTGEGAASADAIRAKLAAINAPAESQAMGQTATSGVAGQSAAALAAGNLAGTDRLAANQNAAEAYAASLPGVVQLAGMQNQRLADASSASGLRTALTDLATKSPELALSLEQNMLNDRSANQKTSLSLASSMQNNYESNELKKAIAAQGFGIDQQKIASQDTRAADDRSSREAIAAANRQSSMARTIARENAATARTKITAGSADGKHLDSLTTSAFQKAASAASRMKAGSYGSSSSSAADLSAILGGAGAVSGSPYTYQRAYNAIYGMVEGTLSQYVNAAGLRKLTLRALAAGGYPVTVAKG